MDENKSHPLHVTGILIYRILRQVEFLLLNDTFSHKRHWTAPKGEVIRQEDEVKCALRNTIEITGLSVKDLRIEEGFRAEITYLSGTRPKRVVYYLAQVSDHARVYTSGEGLHFAWLPLNQAAEKVLYKSMQEVIKQASAFVENNKPPKNSEPQQRSRIEKNQINSDRLESKMKNLNFAIPLDSQRQAMSRQLGREQRQQHNRPEKNGNGFSSPLHSPVMPFENPLYKTRLCERFETERFCPYGSKCTFAHGTAELRERPPGEEKVDVPPTAKDGPDNPLYKTRLCERFMKENFCQYGPKCNFAHGENELRERPNTGQNSITGLSNVNILIYFFKTICRYIQYVVFSPRTEGTQSEKVDQPHNEARKFEDETEEVSKVSEQKAEIDSKPLDEDVNDQKNSSVHTNSFNKNVTVTKRRTGKDILDDEKPWMQVVELSNVEREQLGKMYKDSIHIVKKTDNTATVDKRSNEEVLITDLKRFFIQSSEQNKPISEEIKEITLIETRKDLSKSQLFNILLPSMYDDATWETVNKDLTRKEKLFKTFVRSSQDQVIFLRSWDKFITQRNTSLLPKAPLLFKAFYDNDYVEEDSVLEWYDQAKVSSDVKKKCEVFVNWLKNAEEEE
ncbi:26930_t:CDS:2 [Gigaspora margarita]|uniref:26930_t:CDS:1 n=1 Tax=Gigaspora margarita TaxID=4874 RepID=A0ABN7UMB9_GIGMA|nr:26930_t:CDS:2 [Gigaspora margarita]